MKRFLRLKHQQDETEVKLVNNQLQFGKPPSWSRPEPPRDPFTPIASPSTEHEQQRTIVNEFEKLFLDTQSVDPPQFSLSLQEAISSSSLSSPPPLPLLPSQLNDPQQTVSSELQQSTPIKGSPRLQDDDELRAAARLKKEQEEEERRRKEEDEAVRKQQDEARHRERHAARFTQSEGKLNRHMESRWEEASHLIRSKVETLLTRLEADELRHEVDEDMGLDIRALLRRRTELATRRRQELAAIAALIIILPPGSEMVQTLLTWNRSWNSSTTMKSIHYRINTTVLSPKKRLKFEDSEDFDEEPRPRRPPLTSRDPPSSTGSSHERQGQGSLRADTVAVHAGRSPPVQQIDFGPKEDGNQRWLSPQVINDMFDDEDRGWLRQPLQTTQNRFGAVISSLGHKDKRSELFEDIMSSTNALLLPDQFNEQMDSLSLGWEPQVDLESWVKNQPYEIKALGFTPTACATISQMKAPTSTLQFYGDGFPREHTRRCRTVKYGLTNPHYLRLHLDVITLSHLVGAAYPKKDEPPPDDDEVVVGAEVDVDVDVDVDAGLEEEEHAKVADWIESLRSQDLALPESSGDGQIEDQESEEEWDQDEDGDDVEDVPLREIMMARRKFWCDMYRERDLANGVVPP
ncbi:hypothetical protein T439DRAFT_331922 [Meredithblackwellia eburnea MCA 4105]